MQERMIFLKDLLKNQTGNYVEVGTCLGGFAAFLLDETPATHLTCVDPYRVWPAAEYADSLNSLTEEQNDLKYLGVYSMLKSKFQNRVSFLRAPSVVSSQIFADNSLAFVYIDANHACKAAYEDIKAWLPKLARGGIIAGDDVNDLNKPHDDEGNVKIVHPTGAFGYYGVGRALELIQEEHPLFDYKIVGNQFYYQRP